MWTGNECVGKDISKQLEVSLSANIESALKKKSRMDQDADAYGCLHNHPIGT